MKRPPRLPTRNSATVAALLVAALFIGSGCDDSVNVILESDRKITMFATLDMNSDVQYVRVIPIRGTIDEAIVPGAYSLRSIDLDNGRTVVWEDSLITFDNGSEGLVFYANLRVQPGHSYRIEASGGDSDLITSAVTNVPPIPTPSIGAETASRTIGPSGFILEGRQTIVWHGLQREPLEISHWYRFLRTPESPYRDVRMRNTPSTFQGGDLTVTLDLAGDRFAIADSVEIARNAFVGIGMSITVLNAEFVPPGGVFDPEILVQPGTFSNVENGFGFIGTVGRFSTEWVLNEENVRTLGYLTVEDAFGKAGQRLIQGRRQTAVRR